MNLSIHTAPSVQPPKHSGDLARAQGSSSEELARSGLKPNHRRTFGPAPLQGLRPYYERLCPCAPHRYSGSCGVRHLSFSLRIGTTGSHVPHQSQIHVHAASMPDAGRALNRLASTFIPGPHHCPGFDVVLGLSTRHRRFTFVRLHWIAPDAVIAAPFPATLTTKALYPSSLQRFEVCSCKPTSEGPPPSSVKHRRWCALPPFCGTGSFVRDTLRPNPSPKRSANGRPPSPVWRYAVHFRQPGPGVLPLSPA